MSFNSIPRRSWHGDSRELKRSHFAWNGGTHRADCRSQKGNSTSRRANQLMTNRENQIVAKLSCPTYCESLAASRQMSLGSCKIMTTAPILVYLQAKIFTFWFKRRILLQPSHAYNLHLLNV